MFINLARAFSLSYFARINRIYILTDGRHSENSVVWFRLISLEQESIKYQVALLKVITFK